MFSATQFLHLSSFHDHNTWRLSRPVPTAGHEWIWRPLPQLCLPQQSAPQLLRVDPPPPTAWRSFGALLAVCLCPPIEPFQTQNRMHWNISLMKNFKNLNNFISFPESTYRFSKLWSYVIFGIIKLTRKLFLPIFSSEINSFTEHVIFVEKSDCCFTAKTLGPQEQNLK